MHGSGSRAIACQRSRRVVSGMVAATVAQHLREALLASSGMSVFGLLRCEPMLDGTPVLPALLRPCHSWEAATDAPLLWPLRVFCCHGRVSPSSRCLRSCGGGPRRRAAGRCAGWGRRPAGRGRRSACPPRPCPGGAPGLVRLVQAVDRDDLAAGADFAVLGDELPDRAGQLLQLPDLARRWRASRTTPLAQPAVAGDRPEQDAGPFGQQACGQLGVLAALEARVSRAGAAGRPGPRSVAKRAARW